MNSFVFIFTMVFSSYALIAGGTEPIIKNVNLSSSNIIWKAQKVTGTHEGTVKFKSGNLKFDGENLIGGELTVDMNTIDVTDLTGGSKGKLEGHLKSEDFFGVTKFPAASIKFTKVTSRGTEGAYKVTANITIKNSTKEIKFNVDLKSGAGIANIKLDRSDFDIRYGSGSFFDNLGDKTIYDEFDLGVSIAY